jgi:hypothetical protein
MEIKTLEQEANDFALRYPSAVHIPATDPDETGQHLDRLALKRFVWSRIFWKHVLRELILKAASIFRKAPPNYFPKV